MITEVTRQRPPRRKPFKDGQQHSVRAGLTVVDHDHDLLCLLQSYQNAVLSNSSTLRLVPKKGANRGNDHACCLTDFVLFDESRQAHGAVITRRCGGLGSRLSAPENKFKHTRLCPGRSCSPSHPCTHNRIGGIHSRPLHSTGALPGYLPRCFRRVTVGSVVWL
jgi:hypothetical protein